MFAENNSTYRLKYIGLPALESLKDLADEARLSLNKVRYLGYRSERLYKTFKLLKKNGQFREIAQPSRELKALQAWILRNILDKLHSSPHSKGFEKGTSILDNASPHIGANFILTVDLEDFFPNVKASHIYSVFHSIGYNQKISSLLTSLCTYKGGLPQGAPTSPKLANLTCLKLDSRIHGYAGSKGMVYTRYADDITLSGQTVKKIYRAHCFLETIISDEGFSINNGKTRISGTQRQKKITGLVLSENHAGIGRIKYREIRAKIHHLFIGKESDFSHVNGLLAFTYGVDERNYRRIYAYINTLIAKYPTSSACECISKEILRT